MDTSYERLSNCQISPPQKETRSNVQTSSNNQVLLKHTHHDHFPKDDHDPIDRSPSLKNRTIHQETGLLEKNSNDLTASFFKDKVFFINNEKEKQSLLKEYRKDRKIGSVIEIFTSENMIDNDLLKKKQYLKGKIEKSIGRLFTNECITLVFDFTQMTLDEIAELNDLLEIPATFEGKKLSKSVNRLILVTKDMLTSHYGVPGSDFWRRVQTIFSKNEHEEGATNIIQKSSVQAIDDVLSNKDFLLSKMQCIDQYNDDFLKYTKKTIDFSDIGLEWKTALIGGFCFNEKGKIEYKESLLANLSSSDCIVLHDAPWDNINFVNVLATILRENGYYSNGNIILLPENIPFFKTHTSVDEVEKLKKKWIDSQEHQQISADLSSIIVLNRQAFTEILNSTTQIDAEGYRSINPIIELLRNCTTLFITNQFTNQQWLYLLREIDRQQKKIKIIIDEEIILSLHQEQKIQCHIYSHEENTLDFFKESHDIYQITSEDQWSALWTKTHIMSYHDLIVQQEKTTLLEALMNGNPIVLYGIENNPIIASQLETLLANPSYLFIQGKKITLPKINLIILCHEKKKDQMIQQSSLWKQVFNKKEKANTEITMEDTVRKKGKKRKKRKFALIKVLPTIIKQTLPWKKALHKAEIENDPTDIEDARKSEIDKIVDLIKAIPEMRDYSIYFPWESRDFAKLLDQQTDIERKQDGSDDPLPYHRRKALYTLLVKNYRASENVVGYLKAHIQNIYPDSEDSQANKKALRQWIDQHPCINQPILKEYFWSLVRHCPIKQFNLSFDYNDIDEKSLHLLSFYLMGSVSGEKKENLAKQLNRPIDHAASDDQYYDNNIRKCLYDALFIAGCEHRLVKQAISTLALKLERRISSILKSDTDKEEKISAIKRELQRIFTHEILETDFKDLSLELFHGDKVHLYQQTRRLKKLANHLELHPMIFLQGVAGAGKSHIAQAVVSELQKKEQWKNMPPPMVLSLGPETTKEFLYGSETLVETIDGDKKSEWQVGPILQWAMNPQPPLLILDEANLVKEGVLAPLAGLTMDHPQLCIDGHIYKIPNPHCHRIILTGNPNSYSERAMDSTIQEKLMTFYCRPLSKKVLAECVIEPALPKQYSKEEKKYMKEMILFLFEKYHQLLPNDLSPRDLHDVIASIHHILQDITEQTITNKEIHSLVWTSFEETLATHLSEDKKPSFIALKHWYPHHYPLDDSILEARQRKFELFFFHLKLSNSSLLTETKQINQLIYHYWLFLEKQNSFHQQRRGLLVEGPAGWGKDFILKAVLMQWQKEYSQKEPLFLNANLYNWMDHVQKIKQAMIDGKKVVISEMNILPSSHIEGLFNEVLTSSFNKGFALMATMNPSSFSGREELSIALKNRCQHIKLHPLTKEEISQIVLNNTQDELLRSWFTHRYYILSKKLQESHAHIQLTRSDLSGFLKKISINNTPQKDWGSEFASYYTLAFHSLSLNMEEFEEILKKEREKIGEREDILKNKNELSLYVNETSDQPIIINLLPKDTNPFYNPPTSTLTLPYIDDKELLKKLANKALIFRKESYIAIDVKPSNDITKIKNLFYTQYFPYTIHPGDYRLTVIEYDCNGKIRTIPCTAGGVEIIEPLFSSIEQVKDSENYQRGIISLTVHYNMWKALPGISSDDCLIAIDCQNREQIITGRGNKTGQLLVKLKSTKQHDIFKNIDITFIIAPNESVLRLSSTDEVQIDENLCHPFVRAYFDQYIFSEDARFFSSCRQLQEIQKEQNSLTKISRLLQWINEFSSSENLIGDGLEYIINIIRFKQGVCRHQAQAFYFLSQYFGIPVRNIGNDIHRYVEISLDGQKTWQKINIKGGSHSMINQTPHKNNVYFDQLSNQENQIDQPLCDRSNILDFLLNEKIDFLSRKKMLERYLAKNNIDIYELIKLHSEINNDYFLEIIFEKIKRELRKSKHTHTLENLQIYFIDIFNKNNEILLYLTSLFMDWKKNFQDKIRYSLLKCSIHFAKILVKVYTLFKNKKIKKDDYYYFIKKSIILINNDNIFIVYNILQELIEQSDFDDKTEIIILFNKFKTKFQIKKQIPVNTEILKKPIDLKGKSQLLESILKKQKVHHQWSYFDANSPISLNRFLEGKKPFLINQNKNSQSLVIIPHHFINCPNIYQYIYHFLSKDKQMYFDILHDDRPRTIIKSFLIYFLEKTQKNLLIVCFSNLINNKNSVGCYTVKQSNNSMLDFYNFFRKSLNGTHVPFDDDISAFCEIQPQTVKDLCNESSAFYITQDFLKKCIEEYLETIDWNLLQD